MLYDHNPYLVSGDDSTNGSFISNALITSGAISLPILSFLHIVSISLMMQSRTDYSAELRLIYDRHNSYFISISLQYFFDSSNLSVIFLILLFYFNFVIIFL